MKFAIKVSSLHYKSKAICFPKIPAWHFVQKSNKIVAAKMRTLTIGDSGRIKFDQKY